MADFTYEKFVECIMEIVSISEGIGEGWQLCNKEVGIVNFLN